MDTVHECDGRTDGRTDRITITKTVQRIKMVVPRIRPNDAITNINSSVEMGARVVCVQWDRWFTRYTKVK